MKIEKKIECELEKVEVLCSCGKAYDITEDLQRARLQAEEAKVKEIQAWLEDMYRNNHCISYVRLRFDKDFVECKTGVKP